jgi:hypothetical protein
MDPREASHKCRARTGQPHEHQPAWQEGRGRWRSIGSEQRQEDTRCGQCSCGNQSTMTSNPTPCLTVPPCSNRGYASSARQREPPVHTEDAAQGKVSFRRQVQQGVLRRSAHVIVQNSELWRLEVCWSRRRDSAPAHDAMLAIALCWCSSW